MALKVLIISSYRTACGVASYSEVLRSLLDTDFEIAIAPLDQTILKRMERHVIASGDQQIEKICASFKDYDVVNLQWEPGLLGGRQTDQARRFAWILEAADKLILTVHTAVPYPENRGPLDFLHFVRQHGLRRFHRFFFDGRFERQTYKALQERARSNRTFIVATHTERERHFFKNVVGVRDVFDHPLSHLRAGWPERLAQDRPMARRELDRLLPNKRTFIGIFGFLSEYKGIMTAIRAMKYLDDSHHLLIYGGVHPETIKPREPINAYVKNLLRELEEDSRQEQEQGSKSGKGSFRNAQLGDDTSLLEKVSFVGAPDDDYDFALAVNAVDVCVFPYLEVGQSGSGPASHAIELRKPTILTRTKAFVELGKYFPKQFEMVDVGNYIQLAQTVRKLSRSSKAKPEPRYNARTLAAFYGNLIRRCAGQPPLLDRAQQDNRRLPQATLTAAE